MEHVTSKSYASDKSQKQAEHDNQDQPCWSVYNACGDDKQYKEGRFYPGVEFL